MGISFGWTLFNLLHRAGASKFKGFAKEALSLGIQAARGGKGGVRGSWRVKSDEIKLECG